MSDPKLKQAVWRLLEEIAGREETGGTVHSDFILRKFPKVNEIELINVIGEFVEDGLITVKAATVDEHGTATAYHIRVRETGDRPATASAPPAGGIMESNVGFSGTPSAPSRPAPPEQPRPTEKEEAVDRASRVGVGFESGGVPARSAPDDAQQEERVAIKVTGTTEVVSAMQEEADQNFADEVSSFFSEILAADTTDENARKELTDQLTVLVAMFQSDETDTFTTPISKLAAIKKRVQAVAPGLVNDFVLLMQTGMRSWLGRV